jgi:preprotein translocase subunit Sss1
MTAEGITLIVMIAIGAIGFIYYMKANLPATKE